MGHPTDLDERIAARDEAERDARDPRQRLDYTEVLERKLELAEEELDRILLLADEARIKGWSICAKDLAQHVRITQAEMEELE